jgi:hypothetical protein
MASWQESSSKTYCLLCSWLPYELAFDWLGTIRCIPEEDREDESFVLVCLKKS